jgi:mono/diheme cytochrome c family protein
MDASAKVQSGNGSRWWRAIRVAWLAGGVLVFVAAVPLRVTRVKASSKESRVAGAAVFHEKGCEYCHGAGAVGTEKAPDLSTIGKRRKREQIEYQIVNGGGGMPAFGTVLQPDEVKLLVDWLSSKRKVEGKR